MGPGKIVSTGMKETIRSHHDIFKGNAPHLQKAIKFYTALTEKCSTNGHIVDIFACSLDQVGLAEFKVLVDRTGGFLCLSDSFETRVFKDSFKRVFAQKPAPEDAPEEEADQGLSMVFNGEIEVITSREFKVCGAIGPCSSRHKKTSSVGENETGLGGTAVWALGGVDPTTTIAFYFEVSGAKAATEGPSATHGFVQFKTKYRDSNGSAHMKVTTLAIEFADTTTEDGLQLVAQGFDQEAAAVLVARKAAWQTETEYAQDTLRGLDRNLIQLVSKFATFDKDKPETFRLTREFAFYPQFMFHLRRSQFLQVFNSSPDETAFARLMLCRSDVTNSLTMLQPTLTAYSIDQPAQAVLLDVNSRNPDRILLLDTFFHIVLWYGENIAAWRDDGVQNDPEFEYFAELLQAPQDEKEDIISARFPIPAEVSCDQGTSQARFLTAKLNPSSTHNAPEGQGDGTPQVFTEDVSLHVFMQHLRKLAVSQS